MDFEKMAKVNNTLSILWRIIWIYCTLTIYVTKRRNKQNVACAVPRIFIRYMVTAQFTPFERESRLFLPFHELRAYTASCTTRSRDSKLHKRAMEFDSKRQIQADNVYKAQIAPVGVRASFVRQKIPIICEEIVLDRFCIRTNVKS